MQRACSVDFPSAKSVFRFHAALVFVPSKDCFSTISLQQLGLKSTQLVKGFHQKLLGSVADLFRGFLLLLFRVSLELALFVLPLALLAVGFGNPFQVVDFEGLEGSPKDFRHDFFPHHGRQLVVRNGDGHVVQAVDRRFGELCQMGRAVFARFQVVGVAPSVPFRNGLDFPRRESSRFCTNGVFQRRIVLDVTHHNLYGLPIDVHPGNTGKCHLKGRNRLGRDALELEKHPFFLVVIGPAHQIYRVLQNGRGLFLGALLELVPAYVKGRDRRWRFAVGAVFPGVHGDHAVCHERRTAAAFVEGHGRDVQHLGAVGRARRGVLVPLPGQVSHLAEVEFDLSTDFALRGILQEKTKHWVFRRIVLVEGKIHLAKESVNTLVAAVLGRPELVAGIETDQVEGTVENFVQGHFRLQGVSLVGEELLSVFRGTAFLLRLHGFFHVSDVQGFGIVFVSRNVGSFSRFPAQTVLVAGVSVHTVVGGSPVAAVVWVLAIPPVSSGKAVVGSTEVGQPVVAAMVPSLLFGCLSLLGDRYFVVGAVVPAAVHRKRALAAAVVVVAVVAPAFSLLLHPVPDVVKAVVVYAAVVGVSAAARGRVVVAAAVFVAAVSVASVLDDGSVVVVVVPVVVPMEF
mmetsp:Transcript_99492/g.201762  ORF Transcript_99492/g.201762 Transcript_99492/m.201762 type:complete len:627 (+) Transcript_99492:459-2339(+)